MQDLLAWVASLPVGAIYVVLGVVAAIENVFPPFPADTVVAFGSFLAARGRGSVVAAFLSTWAGNILGAALMYFLGRRFGADRIERRMLGAKKDRMDERMNALYGRYGIAALFISRFVPGVRAIVPPFAGALRIPPLVALPTIAVASGIWYGLIAVMAFRIGDNWEDVTRLLREQGSIAAGVAIAVSIVIAAAWWIRRRRRIGR